MSNLKLSFYQTQAYKHASNKHTSSEVEFDDISNYTDKDFSEADDGCWVRAWTWISNEEMNVIRLGSP